MPMKYIRPDAVAVLEVIMTAEKATSLAEAITIITKEACVARKLNYAEIASRAPDDDDSEPE